MTLFLGVTSVDVLDFGWHRTNALVVAVRTVESQRKVIMLPPVTAIVVVTALSRCVVIVSQTKEQDWKSHRLIGYFNEKGDRVCPHSVADID